MQPETLNRSIQPTPTVHPRGFTPVTPQKVASLNDSTELYLLEAVGTVTDPRYPTSPATRTVRQYAYLNTMPLRAVAALITMENRVDLFEPFQVAGNDIPETGACDGVSGARFSIHGIAGTGTAGNGSSSSGPGEDTVSPDRYQVGATSAEVAAAAEVRWHVIKDPNFNVTYIDEMPNFAAIGADSFPVIRMSDNYTLNQAGRGVLMVRGYFYIGDNMDWDGIILAGKIDNFNSLRKSDDDAARVRGVLVAGLDEFQNVGWPGSLGREPRDPPQRLLRAEGEPFARLSVPNRRLALGLLAGSAKGKSRNAVPDVPPGTVPEPVNDNGTLYGIN